MKVRSSIILTVILSLEMDLNPMVLDPETQLSQNKTQGLFSCTVTTGIKGKGGKGSSDNNGNLL